MQRVTIFGIICLALILASSAGWSQDDPGLIVVVEGAEISFDAPVLMVDMLYPLLPATPLLNALGATSTWDAAAQRLDASLGERRVQMWVGRPWATVDGAAYDFTPGLATFNGQPYLPGPSTAQILGLEATWDRDALTLTISTPVNMPEGPTVAATLLNVRPEGNGTLVVRLRTTGWISEVALAPGVVISRGRADASQPAAPLSDLLPGDAVEIVLGSDGQGIGVSASYRDIFGVISSIEANELRLASGYSFPLGEGIVASGSDGAPMHLLGAVGENALVKFNPVDKEVWSIVSTRAGSATPPDTPEPVLAAFFLPRYDRPQRAGDSVEVRIIGSAGGRATVNFGDTGHSMTLTEGAPGIYSGIYTVPNGIMMLADRPTARLEVGGARSTWVPSNRPIMLDTRPPVIVGVRPDPNAAITERQPQIQARYEDDGSGVDAASVQLIVDGADVTDQATIDLTQTLYTPPVPLAMGGHSVMARVADRAGNTVTNNWVFNVARAGTGIEAVAVEAGAQPLVAGDMVTVTAEVVAPGRAASFAIDGVAEAVPMSLVAGTTTYRGSYTVREADIAADAAVTVQFTAADGTLHQADAPQTLNIGPAAATFTVTVPAAGEETGRRIRPAGTAPPGSTVRWTINYEKFILAGQVGTGTAVAGADGVWQAANEVDLRLLLVGMGDRYTLVAELLGPGEAVQQTEEVQFRARD